MKKHSQIKVQWVRRNRPLAPVPYIVTEEGLPKKQKALVFLPHSDDGRYIGVSLYLMNKRSARRPRNTVKIVVISSGYRSVRGDMTKDEKAAVRWEEAIRWAEMLGYSRDQLIAFRADEMYEMRRGILRGDQEQMDALIREEKPTMVLVPHISDTAQHINFYTRQMVLKSVTGWLGEEYKSGKKDRYVFVVEYPTNHVPILPPSDKNFIIAFTKPENAEIKHEANKAHKSQESKGFDVMGKFVEAIHAMSEADDVLQFSKAGRRFSRYLSGVHPNPRRSRGEHFGVTELRVKLRGGKPVIVEERVKFPLSPQDQVRWGLAASRRS
jgi:LmbE family N-acetylglucosaminyl deacetylase